MASAIFLNREVPYWLQSRITGSAFRGLLLILQKNFMLTDTKIFRNRMGAFRCIDARYPSRVRNRIRLRSFYSLLRSDWVIAQLRDIRATCHTLRLTRAQGNRQAPCGRITSCSGAVSQRRRRFMLKVGCYLRAVSLAVSTPFPDANRTPHALESGLRSNEMKTTGRDPFATFFFLREPSLCVQFILL